MITFSYRLDSVVLRDASLGDQLELDTNMVIAKTMNGTIQTYKGSRPSFYKAKITSEINNKTNMNLLIAFLRNYAGLEIDIETDDTSISGYIISPIAEIVTEKDNCSYSVSLEILYKQGYSDYLYPDPICL